MAEAPGVGKIERERATSSATLNRASMAASMTPETGWAAPMLSGFRQWNDQRLQNKEAKIRQKMMAQNMKMQEQAQKDQEKRMNELRRKTSGSGEHANAELFLFLLGCVVWVLEVFSNWARPPSIALCLLYAFIIFAYYMTVGEKRFDDHGIQKLFGVIAIVIILPVFINYVKASVSYSWMLLIAGFFELFPILLFYMLKEFQDSKIIRKLYVIFITFWVIAGLSMLFTSAAFKETQSTQKAMITNSQASIAFTWKTIWTSFKNVGKSFSNTFENMIDTATGRERSGNAENDRGIQLGELKPLESTFYPSSDVSIDVPVIAKKLPFEVPIRNYCVITDKALKGTAYPQQMTLIHDDQNQFTCRFGQLPIGLYDIRAYSLFEFETTATATYSFVDYKTPTTLYPPETTKEVIATYTGGPVALGMDSRNTPFRISATPVQGIGVYSVGASLKNDWTYGKIVRGLTFTLKVPDSLILENCDRNQSHPSSTLDGMNVYEFTVDQANLKDKFDSVTCYMKVVDYNKLMGAGLYAQKTFEVRATYEYSIEKTTTINVDRE
jgi:hypothetical protein